MLGMAEVSSDSVLTVYFCIRSIFLILDTPQLESCGLFYADNRVQFRRCLGHIFAKYCTPLPASQKNAADPWASNALLVPPAGAHLTPSSLDQWAKDTNGSALPPEAKEELVQLDLTENGNLTYVIFLPCDVLCTTTRAC